MNQLKTFICVVGVLFLSIHATAPPAPPEDSLWYYEIGGAKPVSAPANPRVHSTTIGGSAKLGLGYSCLKFDPVTAVTDTLNQVKDGTENMLNAMTQAATGAIASLPAMILQRANPGLYDLFQNALVRAELTVDLATKSCEQMENAIANNKNPYEDLVVLSKGNDWKVQMGVGGGSVIAANEAVAQANGANGLPWIDGSAGGDGQDPLALTEDITRAGFNVQMNRSPSAQGAVAADPDQRLTLIWNDPSAAADWLVDVVGEHNVTTCEGCEKSTIPGNGLGPVLEQEKRNLTTVLESIVSGSQTPTLSNLERVSAPGIAITRDVIESINTLPVTEQQIVIDRLVAEIAVARTVEKAFIARRLVKSGSSIPEVQANPVAREHVQQVVRELDSEIDRLAFEARIRKDLVSNTATNLLKRHDSREKASLTVPESNSRDPYPLIDGRVESP
ncbi:MAG: integrating conjugative element protein [Gammaproteobacteria bacterium]|nr:integrating conjugative element protein [Gammaproteobacteria bacterium]MYC24397.1 integrating conjugative element protein [Gammaproteobacteria bacterium]